MNTIIKINKYFIIEKEISKRYECINCQGKFFKVWALKSGDYICEFCKSIIERKGTKLELSKKTGKAFLNKRK